MTFENQLIEPHFEILYPSSDITLKAYPAVIEIFGRTAYKSHEKMSEGSADRFCQMLIQRGHESVLEHLSITVKIVCDRSTSHQLVRHRLAAYTQESQRYCTYGEQGKKGPILFVEPPSIQVLDEAHEIWESTMRVVEDSYTRLLALGIPGEDARSVLTNAVKTEVVTTYNLRQWRHFFKMRCDSHAQWQIRRIAKGILRFFHSKLPCIFGDMYEQYIGHGLLCAKCNETIVDPGRPKCYSHVDGEYVPVCISCSLKSARKDKKEGEYDLERGLSTHKIVHNGDNIAPGGVAASIIDMRGQNFEFGGKGDE